MMKEDLMALLEELPDGTEIRIANQPSWPFEYEIDSGPSVIVLDLDNMPEPEDLPEGAEAEDIEAWYEDQGEALDRCPYTYVRPVVYLPEGNQLGYLPGVVARSLGWR